MSQGWLLIAGSTILSFNRSMHPIVFNYIMNGVGPTAAEIRHGRRIRNRHYYPLSWKKHIKSIISIASRMSGLVNKDGIFAPEPNILCIVH